MLCYVGQKELLMLIVLFLSITRKGNKDYILIKSYLNHILPVINAISVELITLALIDLQGYFVRHIHFHSQVTLGSQLIEG